MKIRTFGVARDIMGNSVVEISEAPANVADLRKILGQLYPEMSNIKSYAVAINENYAEDDEVINDGDTVVIIPPVSGG